MRWAVQLHNEASFPYTSLPNLSLRHVCSAGSYLRLCPSPMALPSTAWNFTSQKIPIRYFIGLKLLNWMGTAIYAARIPDDGFRGRSMFIGRAIRTCMLRSLRVPSHRGLDWSRHWRTSIPSVISAGRAEVSGLPALCQIG